MPDLIPVDHSPEFDHSLTPVDYDPFAAEKFANPAVGNMIAGLATLPQRAIENSQNSLNTGTYDPGPTLEAATLPMGTGAIAGVPVRAGEAVMGAGPIRAYHGSPHDFDAFSLDKIGTGEGAQAYGHGLYFAENEGVAKAYRDALAGKSIQTAEGKSLDPDTAVGIMNKRIGEDHPDFGQPSQASKWVFNRLHSGKSAEDIGRDINGMAWDESQKAAAKTALTAADGWKTNPKMYEVNINADPEHFLDWDKGGKKIYNDTMDALPNNLPISEYPKQTIAKLSEQGIPGIKYLDQGSRGAGEGSSNYVVFNDKLIDIIKKYGIAGLPAGFAAAAQSRFIPVDHDPFAESQ